MPGQALVIGVSSACAAEAAPGAAVALAAVLGGVFEFGDGSKKKNQQLVAVLLSLNLKVNSVRVVFLFFDCAW